ncbi:MAG: hypothetical protein B5M54_08065 [Candidatus Aminicenantes bacterium 4484_214]|nr:MAG: hypothetical protein B5M54_08065 [Candidatus Aminicenantes bacterium 4484_214]
MRAPPFTGQEKTPCPFLNKEIKKQFFPMELHLNYKIINKIEKDKVISNFKQSQNFLCQLSPNLGQKWQVQTRLLSPAPWSDKN